MPIHGQIISRGISRLGPVIVAAAKWESKNWDKLYFGIRQDIKHGIRHGSAIGGALGTFINEDGQQTGNGPTLGTPSYKSYKTRGGYTIQQRSKCKCPNKFHSYSRRSRSRFSKAGRGRFKSKRFLRNRRVGSYGARSYRYS